MAAPVPFTREDMASYEAARTPDTSTQAAETPEVENEPVEQVSDDTTSVESEPELTESAEDGSSADESEAAADTDLDSETSEGEKPRSKTIPYDRFQEVVDERNALRKFGEHMLEQVKELKGAKPAAAETSDAPVEPAASDDSPPTLEQFDYDPVEHSKAQAKWLKSQVGKEVAAARAADQAEQSVKLARDTFNSRAEAYAKDNPDFQTVVSNKNIPKLAEEAARMVLTSDVGPALLHHLGKHVDEATRIAKLSVGDQKVALARIEGRLSQAPAKPVPQPAKKRTVTLAPPPPKPVPSGASPKSHNSLDTNNDMNEWVARERTKKLQERDSKMKLRQALSRR